MVPWTLTKNSSAVRLFKHCAGHNAIINISNLTTREEQEGEGERWFAAKVKNPSIRLLSFVVSFAHGLWCISTWIWTHIPNDMHKQGVLKGVEIRRGGEMLRRPGDLM